MAETELLSSLSNALRILEAFKIDDPQKGVREIAQELEIPKSTVHRILHTLSHYGYVRKDHETNKYELGLSILELNTIFLTNLDLHTEALPIVEKLAETYRETSHLAVLDHLDLVYVCKVEGKNSEFTPSYTGLHNFIHCTSSGKLLLASSPRHLAEEVIKNGLERFTDTTFTDPDEFREELNTIYHQGYSISHGEYRSNSSSISAPVRNYNGHVIAAINLVIPTKRFNRSKVEQYIKALTHAGNMISERLGYYER
ncbi:IclR family transcriptional regulator [Oceanobacillus arenosus]|nr:IclR family transcriptional regulator [Oceanobacillus arenosus]